MAETILIARDIVLNRNGRVLLHIPFFSVREGERIGLVGENGAGKSTFLNILAGELEPDGGSVQRRGSVAYARQEDAPRDALAKSKASGRFGAAEYRAGLSGGETERRRLALAFSSGAKLLLLDEPSANLDAEGLNALRDSLRTHRGALILISHDRALLDQSVDAIAELEEGALTLYPGGYTAYREEKERKRDFARFEYEQYRKEKSRLESSAQGTLERASQVRKAPSRMGNSEARLHKRAAGAASQQLDRARNAIDARIRQLEEKPRAREDPEILMRMGARSPIPGKTALSVKGLTLSVPGKTLLQSANLLLPTGSRTALTGSNGSGKTTLLQKIVAGDPAIRPAPAAKIGYFGQDYANSLRVSDTALENVLDGCALSQSDARTVLARLLIRGDAVNRPVSNFSGGEKAKISLARLLCSDSNLLILDEPANYLDVFALEALEEMLLRYAGTLLFVSHDERFILRVATRRVQIQNQSLVSPEDRPQPVQKDDSLEKLIEQMRRVQDLPASNRPKNR